MEQREAGRLLCDCLSGRRLPEAALEQLSPADWASLAHWAERFKVSALLHRDMASRNLPTGLIPADVKDRLRAAYRNRAIVNTSLFCDAAKVLRAMAANQVPVIALKGLSLATPIYGDIALRPMSDIDLLVTKRDLVKAGRMMETLGYKGHLPGWENMVDTHYHLPPFANNNGATVELHWNIVAADSPITVDVDGLWERAYLARLNGVDVRVLCLEDVVIHLCIHAWSHIRSGMDLIPICDIAGLIKGGVDRGDAQIDWRAVVERATRWGGRKCVYVMLLVVRELLNVGAPDAVMKEMKPPDYHPCFMDGALEQILDVNVPGQLVGGRIGDLSRIGKARGIGGKVMALLEKAFPSKEILARRYVVSVSSPRIYWCYVSHLRRMIVCYSVALGRFFRRDPSVIEAVHRERRVSAMADWMFSR